MHDEDRLNGTSGELSGQLEFRSVEGGPGTGGLTVNELVLQPGEVMAVTGGASGAREALLKLAAGLATPVAGRISLGGKSLADATLREVGRVLAYVGSEPGIVTRSFRENLLYGLFRGEPDLATETDAMLADMLREARMTGNSTAHPEGDWIDYDQAGFENASALDDRLLELVELVGLSNEIYSVALEARVDPSQAEIWTERIMEARRHLEDMGEDLSDIVEYWAPDRYNTNAAILENVLFARPVQVRDDFADYVGEPAVTEVLDKIGATPKLIEIGRAIAGEFAELVDAVEGDSPVLDSFAGYGRTDILAASELISALSGSRGGQLNAEQRTLLLRLAFSFVPARDRLDVLEEDEMAMLMEFRSKARELLADRSDFVRFDEDKFNPARTIAGNLLTAARRFDRRNAWRRLDSMMEEAVSKAGFRDDMIRLGLSREVNAGGTLSGSTRRRIALVRGMIKRPGLVILDGIAGSDSPADADLRKVIRAELPDAAILYAALEEEATDIARSPGRHSR